MSASTMPTSNGHPHSKGVATYAESSSSAEAFEDVKHNPATSPTHLQNGFAQLPLQNRNDDLVNHLYHSGFQTGNYADTILQVQQHSYRLHAIILARSPLLVHLMSTSPTSNGQRIIHVPLEQEPEVTQEGFAIALGYLYSSISLTLIRPENCRAVLAAGRLLGGMEDLCQYAYEECRRTISVHTISDWLAFIESLPTSSLDGTSTPVTPTNTIFGPYTQKMREDIFHFLVQTLPEILEIQSPQEPGSTSGRDILLQIFAQVPFDMFKTAVESASFDIGTDQSRFKFAKDAIEIRKRGIARGAGAEETVVLAFGGASIGGSTVHVTRKLKKRPLWKVNS